MKETKKQRESKDRLAGDVIVCLSATWNDHFDHLTEISGHSLKQHWAFL
jgi:hypothetical protein